MGALSSIGAAIRFIGKIAGFYPAYTDEELSETRERARQAHCNGDANAEFTLYCIDKEVQRREYKHEEPGFPVKKDWHRESED